MEVENFLSRGGFYPVDERFGGDSNRGVCFFGRPGLGRLETFCDPILLTKNPAKENDRVNAPEMTLADALAKHQIELPEAQQKQLEQYCKALWSWNEKINLTRHTDFDRFVGRDLVDSLAFAEFLNPGEKILDVGSGGGVPGIVLGIIRPDLKITLSESVGKRATVLRDLVEYLDLPIEVCNERGEKIVARERFDTVIFRAVAKLRKLLTWFEPCWNRFDRMLLAKGPKWVEERGEARHVGLFGNLALRKLKSYPMYGTDSESVLLQICPKDRV